MTSTQQRIVVTSVGHVMPVVNDHNYQLDMGMEVNGIPHVVTVDVTKYEKRHAYNVRNLRQLVGHDPLIEERVRTAAVVAFSGELKPPLIIS